MRVIIRIFAKMRNELKHMRNKKIEQTGLINCIKRPKIRQLNRNLINLTTCFDYFKYKNMNLQIQKYKNIN